MKSLTTGVGFRARLRFGTVPTSIAAFVAVCGSACGIARAQPAAWDAPVTGFWNTASNWNPAVVPNGATFDVTIGVTGGLYDVVLDINPALGSLMLDSSDATLQLQSNTIAIVGGFDMNLGLLRGTGGGGLTVGGTTRFSGVSGGERDVLSAGTLALNGDVLFDLSDDVDICDTDVNYNGSAMTWQGNGELGGGLGSTYTISAATTFTILGNDRFRHNGIGAAPTLINNGVIRKTSGTGTTEFEDVAFTNAGTLEVDSGTVRANGVSTPGNTLTGGTWNVFNGSTLELVGNSITTNAATIHLRDAGSTFAALDGLAVNAAGAEFQVSGGRDFATSAGFTNNGTLLVGTATSFTSSGTFQQGSSTISGGGVVRALGDATFNGPTTAPVVEGGTTFESNAGLTISGSSGLRLDTGGAIDHKGPAGSWTGGDISMGDSSAFTVGAGAAITASNNQSVVWDNTGTRPTFEVAGSFTKSTGTGVTFLDGVAFSNSGTVTVESGTLRSNQPPVTAGTLAEGTWIVRGTSSLDFVGTSITTNGADVTLDGTGATFDALELNLATNLSTGVISLAGGKDLATPGDFTNDGTLNLGAGSILEVPSSSSLTNYNAGTQTLSGGEINVTATTTEPSALRWTDPAFQVKNLASKITLTGQGSLIDNGTRADESALNALDTITQVGSFAINEGRDFRPEGNLVVLEVGPDRGRLAVGVSSLFEIQDDFTLLNFNAGTGELSDGDFDIAGTLSFPGAEIRRVNSTVILAGTGQIINKTTGIEAFGTLEFITPRGDFAITQGKDLDVFPAPGMGPPNTLQVAGRLAVGPGSFGDDSVMTVHGNFLQVGGSVVEVFQGGVLNIQGIGPGTGNYTSDTGSTIHLAGGVLNVQNNLQINGSLTGRGILGGNVIINGEFAPGDSPGQLSVFGSLALTASSLVVIDLTGYGAGVGFDHVGVAGPMSIASGARLEIVASPVDGFEFTFGQVFRVFDAASISGSFDPADVIATPLDGGLYFYLDWNDPTSLRIVVVPAPGTLLPLAVFAARRRPRR